MQDPICQATSGVLVYRKSQNVPAARKWPEWEDDNSRVYPWLMDELEIPYL